VPPDVVEPEILQLICGYLDHESLSAFVKTNRHCSSIANIFLLHTIYISLFNRMMLQQYVDRWITTGLRYVRRLETEGCMPPKNDGLDKPKATRLALGNIGLEYYISDDLLMYNGTEDEDYEMFE
jgi:hypothetical protein